MRTAMAERGDTTGHSQWKRVAGPLVLTGTGLGAFLDGIVLHQILQWHHLVSEFRSPDDLRGLEQNTFWDGVFHFAVWIVVLAGLLWLARVRTDAQALGTRRVVGGLLIGWGIFNVIDEIVFHLLLEAHHIRMVENYQVYDAAYTVLGVLLIASGYLLSRERGTR